MNEGTTYLSWLWELAFERDSNKTLYVRVWSFFFPLNRVSSLSSTRSLSHQENRSSTINLRKFGTRCTPLVIKKEGFDAVGQISCLANSKSRPIDQVSHSINVVIL